MQSCPVYQPAVLRVCLFFFWKIRTTFSYFQLGGASPILKNSLKITNIAGAWNVTKAALVDFRGFFKFFLFKNKPHLILCFIFPHIPFLWYSIIIWKMFVLTLNFRSGFDSSVSHFPFLNLHQINIEFHHSCVILSKLSILSVPWYTLL